MSSTPGNRPPRKAGAFDIRSFIAMLLGLYGVVVLVMGLVGTSEADLRKAGGLNINLWAGIGLLVVAGALLLWATLRPVVVPKTFEAEPEAGAAEAERQEATER